MYNDLNYEPSLPGGRYFSERVNQSETVGSIANLEDSGRRFLLKQIPEDLKISRRQEVEQGYFFEGDATITIERKIEDENVLCSVSEVRRGIRDRIFKHITNEEFEKLWTDVRAKIFKTVNIVEDEFPFGDKYQAEISTYHGHLEGLSVMTLDTEENQEVAPLFMPKWVGKDISHSPQFDEKAMALNQNIIRELNAIDEERFFRMEGNEVVEIPQLDLPNGFGVYWGMLRKAYTKLNNKTLPLLPDGFREKWGMIETKIEQKKPLVVGVAGGSGSGKTTEVTGFLEKNLHLKQVVFSMDNYYRGKKWMEEQAALGNHYNWDQPEALDLDLLREHLAALRRGEKIVVPEYDFTVSERKVLSAEDEKLREIDPTQLEVIIIEGLFALHESLINELDFKTFVNANMETRLMRRMIRDIAERGRSPDSILKAFIETVEPMHQKHIQPTITNADVILNNKYDSEVEPFYSGLHEIQQKYKTGLNREDLIGLGAKFIKSEEQTDVYYNPSDRNPVATGEILRLRTVHQNEGPLAGNKHSIFSFKGPILTQENKTVRPYFECHADGKTGDNFPKIFKDCQKNIKKRRDYFEFEGENGTISFTLDEVYTVINGQKIFMGTFIEIGKVIQSKKVKQRSSPFIKTEVEPYSQTDLDSLDSSELIEALGLENEIPTNLSYFEMV